MSTGSKLNNVGAENTKGDKWNHHDFNLDSIKSELKLVEKHNILFLHIGSLEYCLGATTIRPIASDSGFDSLRILDIDQDGLREIALMTDDVDFGGRSNFHIFKIDKNQIYPMRFYYKDREYFEALTVLNNVILIDKKNQIFYYSSNHLKDENDPQNYCKIDKYQWNPRNERIEYVKSKLYLEEKINHIENITF